MSNSTRRYCHASCCSGETELSGPPGTHDMQLIADEAGIPSGYFGDRHDDILRLMLAAFRQGVVAERKRCAGLVLDMKDDLPPGDAWAISETILIDQ